VVTLAAISMPIASRYYEWRRHRAMENLKALGRLLVTYHPTIKGECLIGGVSDNGEPSADLPRISLDWGWPETYPPPQFPPEFRSTH
jgi:hypothetical protein